MSGTRKAAVPVHIHGPDGITHVFAPGDEVPADLVARVSNPAVWGEDAPDVAQVPTPAPVATAPKVPELPAPAEDDEDHVEADIPPKSGPEGSRAAWAEYAESVGVKVAPTMKRNEIIAAVESAGHPTE